LFSPHPRVPEEKEQNIQTQTTHDNKQDIKHTQTYQYNNNNNNNNNIIKKEAEKILKYKDLTIEIQRM